MAAAVQDRDKRTGISTAVGNVIDYICGFLLIENPFRARQRSNEEQTLSTFEAILQEDNRRRFGENAWAECTEGSLRRHIYDLHFLPDLAIFDGVARYDIEVACYRGIDLSNVVEKAYGRIEMEDKDIYLAISRNSCLIDEYAAEAATRYRTAIVKNLKYIELLGLAKVNWERVRTTVPNTDNIELNLERDSKDTSFFFTVAEHLPEWPEFLEKLHGKMGDRFYELQLHKGVQDSNGIAKQ